MKHIKMIDILKLINEIDMLGDIHLGKNHYHVYVGEEHIKSEYCLSREESVIRAHQAVKDVFKKE